MPVVSGFTVTLADRVKETTSTTGTGTYQLSGAASGFRTFVTGIGSGNRTLYTASLGTSWEVGIGTVTSGAPATISRDSILASSNSNNPVNWGAGTKDIFCDIAATLANQIWAKPSAFPACFIEQRGPTTPSVASFLDFGSIASTARIIHVGWQGVQFSNPTGLNMRLGDSGGIETTGYTSTVGEILVGGSVVTAALFSDVFALSPAISGSGANPHQGHAVLMSISGGLSWSYSSNSTTSIAGFVASGFASGVKSLSAALTTVRLQSGNGSNFNAIGSVTLQIIHAIT